MSVVTQSQLSLAQQWYAQRRALHEEWLWHIGDWACLAKEHPEETDIYLVEYVWEGLLEVRPTGRRSVDTTPARARRPLLSAPELGARSRVAASARLGFSILHHRWNDHHVVFRAIPD